MRATKPVRVGTQTAPRSLRVKFRRWLRSWILRGWDIYLGWTGRISISRSCFPERDSLFSRPLKIISKKELNDIETQENMLYGNTMVVKPKQKLKDIMTRVSEAYRELKPTFDKIERDKKE